MNSEKIKKEESVKLLKVELNETGDYIVISADDPKLFDRFVAGFNQIMNMAEEMPKKLNKIEKQYDGKDDFKSVLEKTSAMSKVNVEFSEEAVVIIDGTFGEGTIKKYFAEVYKEIPDFLPDSDCIIDFIEKITPIVEKTFDRKLQSRKTRMAKYQPQDFKKPTSRATKASRK